MSAIEGYLTIQEASDVIGLSPSQLTRHCKAGKLKAKNIGKQWLIEEEDAEKFSPPPRGNPNFRKNAAKTRGKRT